MAGMENIPEHVGVQEKTVDMLERLQECVEKFLAVAHARNVFAEPETDGEVVKVTAAEIVAGMRFKKAAASSVRGEHECQAVFINGNGEGGHLTVRPVARVLVSAEQVRVEPMISPHALLLAGFTALGFIVGTLLKTKKRK